MTPEERTMAMELELARAKAKAQAAAAARGQKPNEMTLGGAAQAAATGVRGAIEGIPGMIGDIPEAAGRGAGWVSRKTGIGDPEAAQQAVTGAMSNPLSQVALALQKMGITSPETEQQMQSVVRPTSADIGGATDAAVNQLPEGVANTIQDWTRHIPSGGFEKLMQTAGGFVPAAALPGGILTRMARVAAPTAASEGAGAVTHQFGPEVEELARMVAATLAGGGVEVGSSKLANLGQLARKVQTTPGAAERVAQLLRESGMSGQEAALAMRQLGPEATPMDVGSTTLQEGQRIQASGGPGRGVIDPMLRGREAEKNVRLEGDVGAAVGPREQPGDILQALHDRKESIGQQYPAAKANQSRPSALTGIADDLDAEIVNARGEMKGTLQKIRDMLDLPGAKGNLDPSAPGVHAMRVELDNMIKKAAPGSPDYAKLNEYRKRIDAELKDIAPDIKALDEQYTQASREGEAFDTGQKIYENPRGAPTEVAFKQTYDSMTPGEQAHILKGLNVETYRQLGIQANDLTTLQKVLKGDGKWNHEKVAAVIGEDKATALMNAIAREKTFNETYSKVVQGSKTAASQPDAGAGRGRLSRMMSAFKQSTPAMAAAYGIDNSGITSGAVGGAQAIIEGLKSSSASKVKPADFDIADLLTTQDPTRIQAMTEILRRNQADPKTASAVSAMLAALQARQREHGDQGRR